VSFSFDHVHVICADIEAVGPFIRDVIGATELRRNAAIMNWEFELDGVRIFVRQCRDDEPLADAGIRRAGVDHLGFAVPDLDAATDRLTAAGCTVVQPRKQVRAGLATAFLTGPGGLLIELLERG
jgi:catechol 2,3-dioxygenase-like lactoylglutathione lyase family enzyme